MKKTIEIIVYYDIIYMRKTTKKGRMNKMKNKKNKDTKKNKYDKGQIFVKIMAALLAALMVGGVSATLIFALIG